MTLNETGSSSTSRDSYGLEHAASSRPWLSNCPGPQMKKGAGMVRTSLRDVDQTTGSSPSGPGNG